MKNNKSYSASVAASLFGFLILLCSHSSWALVAANFVPLAPGNSWTYADVRNGTTSTVTDTVSPNMVLFNGTYTYEISRSDGEKSYALNDQNGYREFGYYIPSVFINGYGTTRATATYSPPVIDAPANFAIGQVQSGSTTLSIVYQGVATVAGPASYSTQAVGYEYVTIPAGTFNALKLSITQSFNGTASNTGQSIALNCTVTVWVAENIGKVKTTEYCSDGSSHTQNLIAYSIADTSAPSTPSGLTASPASASQINLSWTASTDNVGVTSYKLYRGGALIATLGNVTSYSDTGLTPSTTYSYTIAACDAANNCSAQSTAATATTQAAADTQAPTVPAGLAAVPAGSWQVYLSWTASTDNVGVASYKIFRNGIQAGTSATTNFSDSGLTASASYSYTVAACDAANNCSAPSTAAAATTVAGGAALNLVAGWNLLGNSVNTPLVVAERFANTANVSTVWKWIAATSKWAFYTPSLADGGAAYAASKGYDFLTAINAGEGFWVNAKTAFAAQLPAGTAVTTSDFQDQLVPPNKLPQGWSLIATGDNKTPSDFNKAVGVSPPSPGVIPVNLTTLWTWDSGLSNWYFYAPSLDSNGTLASYITSKNYLNFGANTLTPTTGFWVNHP